MSLRVVPPTDPAPRRSRATASVALFWVCFGLLVAVGAPLSAALPGWWQGVALGLWVSAGTAVATLRFVRGAGWSAADVGLRPRAASLPRFFLGAATAIGIILVDESARRLW